MPKVSYKLNDPNINEFVFFCMLNAPQDVKNRLPLSLYRCTVTTEKMKSFADKASLEKKLLMLAHLGGAFSLCFHPPGYLSKEKLQEILQNYLSGERLKDVDEMIQQHVFVVTDREIMAIYSLMAMNCHSETYMLNRDYSLIAKKVADAHPDSKMYEIERVKSLMEDQKLVVKLLLHNLMNEEFIDSGMNYDDKELRVLMYLHLQRNKYVASSTVIDFFSGVYSPQVISRTLTRLNESQHVMRFPKRWEYAITAMGIQVLSNYIKRVFNQTFSF